MLKIGCIGGCSLIFSAGVLYAELPIIASATTPTNTVVTELPPSDSGEESNAPVVIEISEGEIHGRNIFHNFQEFSVPVNYIASFVNTPDSQADNSFSETNIIASIASQAGKSMPTKIGGILRSEGFETANLFIINPAGIAFENGASIEISGSFFASTGDSIEFKDGLIFSVIDHSQSVFSSAPPSAFGFISSKPSSISLTNSNLSVEPGKTILLSGGELEINDSIISAESGNVVLLAKLDSERKMPVEIDFELPGSVFQGEISINSSETGDYVTTIDVSSQPDGDLGHGSVVIRGGNLTISGFEDLDFFGDPSFTGSSILAEANNKIDVTRTAIDIEVGSNFMMKNGSALSSKKSNEGSAGNIQLNSENIILDNDSKIITVNRSNGVGSSVLIETIDLKILGGSRINASTNNNSGTSGDITVNATGEIRVSGSVQTPVEARSSTINVASAGGGIAGNINICPERLCKPDVLINDAGTLQATSSGSGASASAGNINIYAADLQVLDSAKIINKATGDGKGGAITISSDSVLVSGFGQETVPAEIGSRAENNAEGGEITISSPDIQVLVGGIINAETVGSKKGGAIIIVSDQGEVTIDNGEVTAKSSPAKKGDETANLGSSGDILISANKISIDHEGKVNVTTEGANAGKIDINTSGLINLKGSGEISTSAQAGKGRGGNINIIGLGKRNLVLIEDKASITARSEQGKGGNIFVSAQSVLGATEDNVNANKNSVLGEDGTVEFNTPDVDATTGTLELPETFVDASGVIASRCVSQSSDRSSFYVGERRGLGTSPDLLLAGYLDDDGNARLAGGSGQSVVSSNANFTGLSAKIICSR